MSKVFLSYSRHSERVAAGLAGDIEALGHTVWLDKELSGGQSWWDRILATIRECDVFVFVLDPQSLDSTACKREYRYAADLGKWVLPVLTADGMSMNLLPSALLQIQFVDYRSRDREAALRLARAFLNLPPPRPLPDPLPPSPEVPLSYLGSLGERVDKSTLSYEEQSALIVDLKRSVRDLEARDDVVTLLHRFRKRRDLLAAVADEIDEVLGSTRSAQGSRVVGERMSLPPVVRQIPPETPPTPPPVEAPERRVPSPPPERIPRRSRVICASIGALVGSVLVGFAFAEIPDFRDGVLLAVSLGWGGIPWAVGGAIMAMRLRLIGVAALTAVTGFFIALALAGSNRDAAAIAMVFGAGGGQLAGAVAGVLWTRRRRSVASPAGERV